MKFKKYILFYFLFAIILIIITNVIVNYFVSLSPPSFIKISGDLNSWILFNGNMVGSLLGGVIAGIIAFYIAKLQIEKEHKNILESQKNELKYKLKLDTNTQILSVINSYLNTLLSISQTIHKLIAHTNSYKALLDKKSYQDESSFQNINALFKRDYKELFDSSFKLYDLQIEIKNIYSSHKIIIYENSEDLDKIISMFNDVTKKINLLKETYSNVHSKINMRFHIDDKYIEEVLIRFSDYKDIANKINHSMKCLSIDIQNNFSSIFNITLEKPEYKYEL